MTHKSSSYINKRVDKEIAETPLNKQLSQGGNSLMAKLQVMVWTWVPPDIVIETLSFKKNTA